VFGKPFAQFIVIAASLLGWQLHTSPCVADILVQFDQPEYTVTGPGQSFQAQILIDADTSRDGLQPIPGGLFSFGTLVSFDATKAVVGSVNDIDTVAALSFFGFAAGAFEQVAPGSAGTKGNINQFPNPQVPYSGTLLATITITNLAAPIDQYPLNLDFFNTLGANENIFVDGPGNTLDLDITFIPSLVRVIPEPSLMGPLVLGIATLMSRRARRVAGANRTYQQTHDAPTI